MPRVQDSALKGTREYVFDDFSGGSNLVLAEHRQQERAPSAFLLAHDMEIGVGGDLERRAGLHRVSLVDRRTGFDLTQATLRLVRFRRVNARPLLCVVTPTALYRFNPLYPTWNCEEVLLDSGGPVFSDPARTVDVEVFNNRLYLASPGNLLVEWDGTHPATLVSQDWPENFRKPSIIRRHMGRLFLTGFRGINDTRACSDLRYTEIADARTLNEAMLEIRTNDDDMPTAMGSFMLSDLTDSTRAVLAIWKRNSTHVLLGDTFSDLAGTAQASNVTLKTVSTIRGCTGPAAWCAGAKGLYFHDETGVFLLSGPTQIDEASFAVSPCWAGRRTLASVDHPKVLSRGMEYAALQYDPKRRCVVCLLPYELGTSREDEDDPTAEPGDTVDLLQGAGDFDFGSSQMRDNRVYVEYNESEAVRGGCHWSIEDSAPDLAGQSCLRMDVGNTGDSTILLRAYHPQSAQNPLTLTLTAKVRASAACSVTANIKQLPVSGDDGGYHLQALNGTRVAQPDAPTTAPTLTPAAGGSLVADRYYWYKYSFYGTGSGSIVDAGETTCSPAAMALTTSANKTVGLADLPSQATNWAKRIYRAGPYTDPAYVPADIEYKVIRAAITATSLSDAGTVSPPGDWVAPQINTVSLGSKAPVDVATGNVSYTPSTGQAVPTPNVWTDLTWTVEMARQDYQSVTVGTTGVDIGTDVITATSHYFPDGCPVTYAKGTGALLSPLVDGATYYVIRLGANTFQLALTPGGAAIDLTTTGSAGQTFTAQWAKITNCGIRDNNDFTSLEEMDAAIRHLALTFSVSSLAAGNVVRFAEVRLNWTAEEYPETPVSPNLLPEPARRFGAWSGTTWTPYTWLQLQALGWEAGGMTLASPDPIVEDWAKPVPDRFTTAGDWAALKINSDASTDRWYRLRVDVPQGMQPDAILLCSWVSDYMGGGGVRILNSDADKTLLSAASVVSGYANAQISHAFLDPPAGGWVFEEPHFYVEWFFPKQTAVSPTLALPSLYILYGYDFPDPQPATEWPTSIGDLTAVLHEVTGGWTFHPSVVASAMAYDNEKERFYFAGDHFFAEYGPRGAESVRGRLDVGFRWDSSPNRYARLCHVELHMTGDPQDVGVRFEMDGQVIGDGEYVRALSPRSHERVWGTSGASSLVYAADGDRYAKAHPQVLRFPAPRGSRGLLSRITVRASGGGDFTLHRAFVRYAEGWR